MNTRNLTPAARVLRLARFYSSDAAWRATTPRRTAESLVLAGRLLGRDGETGRAAWRAAWHSARTLARIAALYHVAPAASTAAARAVLAPFGIAALRERPYSSDGRAAFVALVPFRDYTRRRGGSWRVAAWPILAP